VWRGSQTEAKFSRALNLLPISREVSKFWFLFNIFWPKLPPDSCKGNRFAPLRFSILFLIFWFRLSMYMLSAYVSLPAFIHCTDCSYFLDIKYFTACVIRWCGIPMSSPCTIKFGQKQTKIHYEKLPPAPPTHRHLVWSYSRWLEGISYAGINVWTDGVGGGGGSVSGIWFRMWSFILI